MNFSPRFIRHSMQNWKLFQEKNILGGVETRQRNFIYEKYRILITELKISSSMQQEFFKIRTKPTVHLFVTLVTIPILKWWAILMFFQFFANNFFFSRISFFIRRVSANKSLNFITLAKTGASAQINLSACVRDCLVVHWGTKNVPKCPA